MSSIFKDILIRITGNIHAQVLLERAVIICQFLMGIGSGSCVESSGEFRILNLLRQRYEHPYCIFDVGSNRGQYLHLILRVLGYNNIKVHCFEPNSQSFNILKNKGEIEFKDNIIFNNFALGKKEGELILYFDKPGSELASLTKRRLDHFGIDQDNMERVRVDTIDNYCQDNRIYHINLLKIDVEGHELDVLGGAYRMLHNRAIDIISFEFGGCNIDTRTYFQDFYYLFKNVNMDLFRITPSGYLRPLINYREIEEQFRTTNLLAMKSY